LIKEVSTKAAKAAFSLFGQDTAQTLGGFEQPHMGVYLAGTVTLLKVAREKTLNASIPD
jgi:hypothetical protein